MKSKLKKKKKKKKKSKQKKKDGRVSFSSSSSPARVLMLLKLVPCSVEGKVRESFAVVKRSEDPYEDFRRSMMEMKGYAGTLGWLLLLGIKGQENDFRLSDFFTLQISYLFWFQGIAYRCKGSISLQNTYIYSIKPVEL